MLVADEDFMVKALNATTPAEIIRSEVGGLLCATNGEWLLC
jgi:hypothetical protein